MVVVEAARDSGERISVFRADLALAERCIEPGSVAKRFGSLFGAFGMAPGGPPVATQDVGGWGSVTGGVEFAEPTGQGRFDLIGPTANGFHVAERSGQRADIERRHIECLERCESDGTHRKKYANVCSFWFKKSHSNQR